MARNARRAAASIDLERRLSGSRRLSISHSDLEPVYHSKQDIDSRRAAARAVSPFPSCYPILTVWLLR